MGTWSIVLALLLSLARHNAAATVKDKGGALCYDCNYDPAGGNPQAGYSHCALQSTLDASLVDKWQCTAGRCFVRLDSNGLVYRGCADPSVLPMGVSEAHQCQPQGPDKSYWRICNGDLCNDGDVDKDSCKTGYDDTDDGVTGNDVSMYEAEYEVREMGYDVDSNGNDGANEAGYDVSNAGSDIERPGNDPTGYDFGYGFGNTGYGIAIAAKEAPVEALIRNQHDRYSLTDDPFGFMNFHRFGLQRYAQQERTEETYDEPVETYNEVEAKESNEVDEYNPCDGKCQDNPSGLFADSTRQDRFIQCGVSDEGAQACSCCKMFYVSCPGSTRFDDVTKVCVGASGHY